jgi:hypothetical protein
MTRSVKLANGTFEGFHVPCTIRVVDGEIVELIMDESTDNAIIAFRNDQPRPYLISKLTLTLLNDMNEGDSE